VTKEKTKGVKEGEGGTIGWRRSHALSWAGRRGCGTAHKEEKRSPAAEKREKGKTINQTDRYGGRGEINWGAGVWGAAGDTGKHLSGTRREKGRKGRSR